MKFCAVIFACAAYLANSTFVQPLPPINVTPMNTPSPVVTPTSQQNKVVSESKPVLSQLPNSYVQQTPKLFETLKGIVSSKLNDNDKKQLDDLLEVTAFLKTTQLANMRSDLRDALFKDLPLYKRNNFSPQEEQAILKGGDIQLHIQ